MNTALNIHDVRAEMPNYAAYAGSSTMDHILGIAIHHSANANPVLGLSTDNAAHIFSYHVETLGWDHGGYHYVIHPNGLIEYALDEQIAAYHAGFSDPDDDMGLAHGQHWNSHYLAICLTGWFDSDRTKTLADGRTFIIPNRFITPPEKQLDSLVTLLKDLMLKYHVPCENVQGHRELRGSKTSCPGKNFNLDNLRAQLCLSDE